MLKAHPGACKEKDSDQNTPLHLALKNKAPAEVTLVVLKAFPGACKEKDSTQSTPLRYALAYQAPAEVTLALLAAHPDACKEKDSYQRTPLHLALYYKAPAEVTLALLAAHPGVCKEKDSDQKTPLDVGNTSLDELFQLALDNEDVVAVCSLLGVMEDTDQAQSQTLALLAAHPGACKEKNSYQRTPLHLALEYKAPAEVQLAVLAAHPGACKEKDSDQKTPLELGTTSLMGLLRLFQLAIAKEDVITACFLLGMMEDTDQAESQEKLKQLSKKFSDSFRELYGPLVDESKSNSIAVTEQLRAMLDQNLANSTFAETHGFGHLVPLLCHLDAAVYTAAAGAVAAACQDPACAEAMVVHANGGMAQRLVHLLVQEKGVAQVHAATALGRASNHQGGCKEEIKRALDKSPDAAEVLAILTDSENKTLVVLAAGLIKIVAPDKDIKTLKKRGLGRMFEKPWPSTEFRKYESNPAWSEPSDGQQAAPPASLVGTTVFVEGEGEGRIVQFHPSGMCSSPGAGQHQIDFVLKGRKKVALKRTVKGGKQRAWLVPADATANSSLLTWQKHGGNAITTKMYTRGASKNDVCMWMYGTKGICHHYAGLFGWIFDNVKPNEAAGTVLLNMARNGSEYKTLTVHVTIENHRKELLNAIAGLAGFLGRYLLSPGAPIHTSATCVLIIAEDRQQQNDDGTLKKVALKCMKNEEQFLTELRVREGLDGSKVMGALRVHVAPDFQHAALSQEASDIMEPEPETDGSEAKAEAPSSQTILFGVEVLYDDSLSKGADSVDKRLTGKFVIAMDCADCDLGSDISHGHYAGRDRKRVKRVLKKVIECFKYCAKQQFVHADIKPLNLVIISIGSGFIIKLIDFDASAKYGEICHLKFSSAFAPPQLAVELLEYEQETGDKPTDASAAKPWAVWVQERGVLKASVAIDIWAFGMLAFKLCVEDGASMFLSSEADNIVQRADLEVLAYGWEQRKFEEIKRVVWPDAADMILKCLQTAEERRAGSFEELEQHPFIFDEEDEDVSGDGEADPDSEPEAELQVEAEPEPELEEPESEQSEDQPEPEQPEQPTEQPEQAASVGGSSAQSVNPRLFFPTPVADRARHLHTASQEGNVDEIDQLLKTGGVQPGMLLSTTGDTAVSYATPIDRAARFGQLEAIKKMVAELQHEQTVRVVLDAQTKYGFTALHFACQYGYADIANDLIEAGISTHLTNYRGQTAWDIAQAREQSAVLKVLEAHVKPEKSDVAPHKALSAELARREQRPEVASTFRDDIELDLLRFIFWCIELFDNWEQLAEGAFGLVYRVSNILTIEINGRHFDEAAVKVAKASGVEELKGEVQGLGQLSHENIVQVRAFAASTVVPWNANISFPLTL
eukprot:COSAG06_NODE_2946_length_6041_cov_16.046914_2_plen_1368_part_00